MNVHTHNSDQALFIGLEAEGPHAGQKTLFVKNLVPYDVISEHLIAHNCERIYFGAGMMSAFSPLTVNKFLLAGTLCTVESLSADTLNELPDHPNLTIHYSVFVKGVRENNDVSQIKPLKHCLANVKYKVDTGKTCLFFDTPPISLNTFDGYPSDIVLFYKEVPND
jgi:hypothetical protein